MYAMRCHRGRTWSRRTVIVTRTACLALVAMLLACDGENGAQDPAGPTTPIEGSLSVTLVSLPSGDPVVGALVQLDPGVRVGVSDEDGVVEFLALPLGAGEATFSLHAERQGFSDVQVNVTLRSDNPSQELRLGMLPVSEAPPDSPGSPGFPNPLRVAVIVNLPVGESGLTYRIRLENLGSEPLAAVVVEDSIDAALGHRLEHGDVTLNEGDFPGARVTLGGDGLTVRVEVDAMDPTTGPVEVFRLTVPVPSAAGIFCNRAMASALSDGSAVAHEDHACVVLSSGWPGHRAVPYE